jgi:hypothetical protein
MNIGNKTSAGEDPTNAPRGTQHPHDFGISEQNSAKAALERYLAFLRLTEVEQARILEQVMSRASAGDPGRWQGEVIRELNRALASQTQADLTAERARVPFSRTGTIPLDAEDSIISSSTDWCAAAWMISSHAERSVPRNFAPSGQTRLTSMPPINRRPMAPKPIEYISLRGLRRALLAWLLGKAPAPVSLGRIPGK